VSSLGDLLVAHRDSVTRFVAPRAGWLLRYETLDDLVQGIQTRALERGEGFRYESEARFVAWLQQVARSYLADRSNYWTALKRRAAALLRLTAAESAYDDGRSVPMPAARRTGPSTFAQRREQLSLAVQVLATLSEKDQRLVRWSTRGVDLKEQAKRLGVSYAAAKKASARAVDRFRKAYRFAAGI
jgi:RNA polymerase sigma factor (sigma-70 family)